MNIETIKNVPLGSLGGPEYIRQEQEAGIELLKEKIARAKAALEEALSLEDTELKDIKIKQAQNELKTTTDNLEETK